MRVGQELGVALKSFADRCEAEVGTRGGLILTKVCLGQPEGKKSAGKHGAIQACKYRRTASGRHVMRNGVS